MTQIINEQERLDLLDKKLKREYDKMMSDMKHDLSKEHHWEERAKAQDKQWKIQEKHWEKQDKYWTTTVIIAIVAMILTAFVTVAIDKL